MTRHGRRPNSEWTPGAIDPSRVVQLHVAPLQLGVLEADFTDLVVDWAKRWGWMVNHQRPAMVRAGKFITATQGMVGFPDLVLCHEDRKIGLLRELKCGRNKLSPEQEAWGASMKAAGWDWGVWRETQWNTEIAPFLAGVDTA